MNYPNLAKALNITLSELESLDFYNQEIFDEGGIVVKNKYTFNKNSPKEILSKIKGLDENNSITLNV
ncbi:hypothetical protein AHMF7605_10500 [Adhaeribacter arboris]|uniref:Uncharacterized protein n=1 Tax=Adhaeribacter arboris TaxID=2072846 RepID=A0A2T2YEH8_9BACT|nr:hypothetical protein [Adhaeribacter arboris]PSR53916.1 hypothetical protein AHMF7605_10500 [Adhaeribacter arboris]